MKVLLRGEVVRRKGFHKYLIYVLFVDLNERHNGIPTLYLAINAVIQTVAFGFESILVICDL